MPYTYTARVRWDGDVITDLNTLIDEPGVYLESCMAVNNQNVTLARGTLYSETRAFLLVPTAEELPSPPPEPTPHHLT